MDFYIFTPGFKRIGMIQKYESIIWHRKFYECGEFEIHCAYDKKAFDKFAKGNIVWKQGTDQAGFVEYRDIHVDKNKKEVLVVKGRMMLGYLAKRIIWITAVLNGMVENGIRQLVDENAINPADPARKIPALKLGASNNFSETFRKQVSHDNLLETIETISRAHEYGLRMKFNPMGKNLVFDVFKGLDRTTSQEVNRKVIFSPDWENILSQMHVDDATDFKNVALIGGEGEGAERAFESVGTASGIDRQEIFVDGSTIRKEVDGVVVPDNEYKELLIDLGQEELNKRLAITSFDSEIDLHSSVQYERDFDLGDKVTLVNKQWGLAVDKPITEVEEVYEKTRSVFVTFGERPLTLTDKIKKGLI